MPMIRLDLLSKDRLIELASTKPEFIKGFEHLVIDALCAKLQQQGNMQSPTIVSNGSRVSFKS